MKTCFLLITGSIAAIKVPDIIRELQKKNFDVHCVLTKAAREFVTPRALAAISNNPVLENEWWSEKKRREGVLAEPEYEHLDFAKRADVFLVAPATADTIARLASGRANGLFEATVLASNAPLLIAPAMNSKMLAAHTTQTNIDRLKKNGTTILSTNRGILACGETGDGKLLHPKDIALFAKRAVTPQTLKRKKVLITLGATQEMLDPVRCLTNISSGKMGVALATQAFLCGAEVTIIAGKNEVIQKVSCAQLPIFQGITYATSAEEMLCTTQKAIDNCDYAFFVAAVCDFAPEKKQEEKIHDGFSSLQWKKTPDIAAEMGKRKKKHQQFFGFALQTKTSPPIMRTEGGIKKNNQSVQSKNSITPEQVARKKMEKKNLDGIFLNFPSNLQSEHGELFFLQKNGESKKIQGTKMEMAEEIIFQLLNF